VRRAAGVVAAIFVVLAGTLAVCEWAARIVTGLDGAGASRERVDFASRIPASGFQSDTVGTGRIVQTAYGSRFELHPYFGYTYVRGDEGMNRHGFLSDFPGWPG